MYKITIDIPRNYVEVHLGGLLTVEETAAYIAELRHANVTKGMRAAYGMVIEVTKCVIQSQDMLRAMGEHMASMPKARAISVVTGSSLARMQIRRLFTQTYARITATLDEGRAWVLLGKEPVAE